MKRWVLIAIAAICAVGFSALGVWQIERRAWKLALIERVEARVHAAPVAAPGPADWPTITRENAEYRRVTATGHFLAGRQTLVRAVTGLGEGFWLMEPLQTSHGFTVLVNRGFVPNGWRPDEPPAQDAAHTDAALRPNAAGAAEAQAAGVAGASDTAGPANTADPANAADPANTAGLANTASAAGTAGLANTASAAGTAGLANTANAAGTAVADSHAAAPMADAAADAAVDGTVSITGLLRISEPHGGFLRANAPAENRWYSRDVDAISQARHLTQVAPYFIDAEADASAQTADASRPPVAGLTVVQFRNSHLQYVFTWFTLALMALVLGIRVARNR